MKINFLRFAVLFSVSAASVLVIDACKKERPDTDTQSSVDNSICEGEFSRIFPQTHGIAVGDSGVNKWGGDLPLPLNSCPDYHIDSLDNADGFPKTVWMAYGVDNDGDSIYDVPCVGPDGKARKGIIKAVFTDHWSKPGATISHSFLNYYVDGIKFEGTVNVSHSGNSYTQVVTGGKCSKGSEWTILWDCNRTVSVSLGDTSNVNDDVVMISGNASGTDRRGKVFSVEIDANNPLKRTVCPYIVQGIQTIKLEGKKDRTINYGDGTCDNLATLTIDGNEFEFHLQ